MALGPRQSKCPFVYECPRQENSDPIERLCCGTADTAERSPLNAIDPSLLGGDRIIDTIVQDAGAVYYLWMISSFRHGPIYRATCDFTGTRTPLSWYDVCFDLARSSPQCHFLQFPGAIPIGFCLCQYRHRGWCINLEQRADMSTR